MPYVAAAVCILLVILAVLRRVEARRLSRLFRAQSEWAEAMDRR
jgi:hypothetical protein